MTNCINSNDGIGQLCPHVTTEVDCESLFTEANQAASPRQEQTKVHMYEDLVVIKHTLGRLYCHTMDVKAMYFKRWKD